MESKELPAPVVIPAELKELSRQIEYWRLTRPYRMSMPETLRKACGERRQAAWPRACCALHAP